MTELKSILKLSEPEILIKQLYLSGYSFAVWRMPQTKEVNMLVSLKEINQLNDLQISNLDTGFLLNRYADNHPVKPFYIHGDIIVQNDDITINPSVKSSEIDEFKKRINKNTTTKFSQRAKDIESLNAFEASVSKAVKEIEKGTFEKVVLSRYRDEELPEDFNLWNFYQTICEKYTDAFCSITHIPGSGIWVGATPELMISNNSERFKTVSLAGTKPLDEGQQLNEIAWTQKEIEEQAFVSRYVINCFKKIRLREFHEHGPKTIKAGSLAHLKTEFIVNYDEVAFDELADQMLELLHPTSAVCGMPIDQTKPWLQKEEKYDREFYSGFLGPVNFENSTDLFVNLRCMKVDNGIIRLFAGAGITEDSDPNKEYAETEMKMSILESNIR